MATLLDKGKVNVLEGRINVLKEQKKELKKALANANKRLKTREAKCLKYKLEKQALQVELKKHKSQNKQLLNAFGMELDLECPKGHTYFV